MIFRLILFGFGLVMKTAFFITSIKDRAFKSRIQNKKFIMQVKIRDENRGRFYKLDNGKFTSRGKISPESPGILIEWKDASTALKTLLTRNLKVLYLSLTDAITSNQLSVEIDHAQTYSFLETIKEMAMVYSGLLPVLQKIMGTPKMAS